MITERLTQIKNDIDKSIAKRSNLDMPHEIKLVAVTKNHDIHAMRVAIDAGIITVGENRIQEAMDKAASLDRDVEWHLIGHLQTNKVKQAVKLFDLIHSVDSEKLILAIDQAANEAHKVQEVLLQVNVAREESKFGIDSVEVMTFAAFISQLRNVKLCGLMAIAPHYEDIELTRPVFKKMFNLFVELKNRNIENIDMRWLSMGMSNDYQIAIEEGANIVRIGTGIFGQRQY